MSNVFLSLMAATSQQARADFIRKTRQPDEVQAKFLRSLLKVQQNTELGQQYGLSDIQTIEQFQQRLPVSPYSSFEPYIERAARGERNVLTADPIIYFNMTSGSTGKRKLIPVTQRSRRATSRANQVSMGFGVEAARRRNLKLGKLLLTSSANSLGQTESGIPFGPVSVSHLRLTNHIYRQIFTHPFEALKISDSTARHYLCLLFALRNANLGIIGANFPVLGLRLCDYLEQYAEDLIDDMASGEIANWLKLDPALRSQIEQHWSASPERAAQLREILKAEGRLAPKDAWKKLSFIITARGGTSNFYLERFPHYFGNTPVFGGTYASAEGTFGVHRDFNTDDAILALESGFYEFIPEDQWEVEQPKTLLPSEVQVGDRYRILTTNYNGFYRYDIGDVVEVTGFYNQTPLFIFRHRRGGMISSTTEKTTEFHVVHVMNQLQQAFNVSLENFCVSLSEHEVPPHYLVNIELAPGHTLADPDAFIQAFDEKLRDTHQSYEFKRRDQVPPPRLRILAPGSFAQVRQRMLQRGVFESQIKFPQISNDRQLLRGLEVLQEVKAKDEVKV